MPLGTAVRRIGGRLKPWGDIIGAIVDRSLPSWIDAGAHANLPWTRSILVRNVDIARFDGRMISKPGSHHEAPEDCSLTDAKDILNLHGNLSVDLQEVFSREIAARKQSGARKVVPMASVIERAKAEISVAEVGARAGWNPRQVRWALRPFEDSRTACGWSRIAIERSGILTASVDWATQPRRRNAPIMGRDSL